MIMPGQALPESKFLVLLVPFVVPSSYMATIPRVLHEHINSAFPINVCLVATVLPNGFPQVSPRGSTMVFDGEHLALWERGKGTTNENLQDGTKVTVFFRKS